MGRRDDPLGGGIESRHEVRRTVNGYDQISNYMFYVLAWSSCGEPGHDRGDRRAAQRRGVPSTAWRGKFARSIVNQFMARRGMLGRVGDADRAEDLGPHEWRVRDLARELKMPAKTMRHWYHRGWVLGRMSAETTGCWILWADEAELERLRRLRPWRPIGIKMKASPRASRRREVAKNVDETGPPKRHGIQTAMALIAKGEQVNKQR